MAAKTKINDQGDVIFSEEDAIDWLYNDPSFNISKLYLKDIEDALSSGTGKDAQVKVKLGKGELIFNNVNL